MEYETPYEAIQHEIGRIVPDGGPVTTAQAKAKIAEHKTALKLVDEAIRAKEAALAKNEDLMKIFYGGSSSTDQSIPPTYSAGDRSAWGGKKRSYAIASADNDLGHIESGKGQRDPKTELLVIEISNTRAFIDKYRVSISGTGENAAYTWDQEMLRMNFEKLFAEQQRNQVLHHNEQGKTDFKLHKIDGVLTVAIVVKRDDQEGPPHTKHIVEYINNSAQTLIDLAITDPRIGDERKTRRCATVLWSKNWQNTVKIAAGMPLFGSQMRFGGSQSGVAGTEETTQTVHVPQQVTEAGTSATLGFADAALPEVAAKDKDATDMEE